MGCLILRQVFCDKKAFGGEKGLHGVCDVATST